MTYYTPGPWVPDPIEGGDTEILIPKPRIIIDMPGLNTRMAIANAYLVATAPDLYEAITYLLPLAKGYRALPKTNSARDSNTRMINAAENTLFRAEGLIP